VPTVAQRAKVGCLPPRVQNVSKISSAYGAGISSVEQSDRVFRCRGTQVHVALRRRQVRVAVELLDGRAGAPFIASCEQNVMPQDVHALLDARDALSAPNG